MDENQIKKALQKQASELTPMDVPSIEHILRRKKTKRWFKKPVWQMVTAAAAAVIVLVGVQSVDLDRQHPETMVSLRSEGVGAKMGESMIYTSMPNYILGQEIENAQNIGEKLGTNNTLGWTLEGIENEVDIYEIKGLHDRVAVKQDGKWFEYKEQKNQ